MENVIAALADKEDIEHQSKYVSEDPIYPCENVDRKYRSSCYFYQTSRMMQIFGPDFEKISRTCSSIESEYHLYCFASLGRDIGGHYQTKIEEMAKACRLAPSGEDRGNCVKGVAEDLFWDRSGMEMS